MQFIRFWDSPFNDKTHRRILIVLGHAFFLALGILSLVHYRERMLHFDTANYVFHLVYTGDFYIAHDRIITYLTQLLPLEMIKAGASLKTVLMSYSLSFILFYYIIFVTIVHVFRNPVGGILMAMALGLTVRYKFYGPVGEVVLSIALAALVLGWLSRDRARLVLPQWLDVLIGCGLGALMLTSHPFIIISFPFAWLIWAVYSGYWKKWLYWLIPLITGSLFLYRYKFSGGNTSSYESGRMNRLNQSWDVLSNLSDYYVWDRFLFFLRAHYTLPVLIFGGLLIVWLFYRRWLSVLASLLGFATVAAIVMIMHNYLSAPIYIMFDGYLSHLGLVMAVPLGLALGGNPKRWTTLLVFFLLAFSVDRINGIHQFFEEREQILTGIIDANTTPPENRVLADMEAFDWERLWMPWAVGVETLMMTNLDDPEHGKTLYFLQYGEDWDAEIEKRNSLFLSIHYAPTFFNVKQFPPQLKLPDGKYKKVDIDGKY